MFGKLKAGVQNFYIFVSPLNSSRNQISYHHQGILSVFRSNTKVNVCADLFDGFYTNKLEKWNRDKGRPEGQNSSLC